MDQGQPLRNQGPVADQVRRTGTGEIVFRRTGSIRRFRPAVRRRQTEPEDRGGADPVSPEDLRFHEHQSLCGWMAAAAHVGQGCRQTVLHQVSATPAGWRGCRATPRTLVHPITLRRSYLRMRRLESAASAYRDGANRTDEWIRW